MKHHNIGPVYDKDSKVLILGSFPSVKSREAKFFYGHPQNRFWKALSNITNYPIPESTHDKKKMLLENRIGVWDVIASCDIEGSADNTIKNAVPNNLMNIINNSSINVIFTNGGTADNSYKKFNKELDIKCIKLPSTSPANARYSLEKLTLEWNVIKDYI